MRTVRMLTLASTAALVATLTACGGSGSSESSADTVSWWTWDDKQAVSYQKCADLFEEKNPGMTVDIKQYAWDDYWTKLTTGFVSGTGPDAFQDHISYYPEFADQGQILALDDLIAENDFDMSRFAVGTDTWTYTDGSTYGLPKDWATVAFYYNADMVEKAGITKKEMDSLTWNPQDGGTFEKVVAHLTVDKNGVRGDEPGFDPENVEVFGVSGVGNNGLNGQDTWAQFLSTTGWTLGDEENWPTQLMYADQAFKDGISYMRGIADKGFGPRDGEFTMGTVEQLGSGKAAIVSSGSWYAPDFQALPGIEVAIAPSVVGPSGERSSITNSNADSIWSGSDNVDGAWKWISFMGSAECQSVAGKDGTFFPSIEESMKVAEKASADKGIDISPFTDQFKDGTLFTTPMFKHGKELDSTLTPMIEAYFNYERDVDVFDEMTAASQQILGK